MLHNLINIFNENKLQCVLILIYFIDIVISTYNTYEFVNYYTHCSLLTI